MTRRTVRATDVKRGLQGWQVHISNQLVCAVQADHVHSASHTAVVHKLYMLHL